MKNLIITAITALAPIAGIASNYDFNPATHEIVFNDSVYKLGHDTFLLTPQSSETAYVFNDPLKAMESIDLNCTGRMTLLVAPGVYWLDDPDDPSVRKGDKDSGGIPYAVRLGCDTLSMIGLTDDPANVVFAVNRGQTQGALGNYTMFHYTGQCLSIRNITFGNYCNVDLIYPQNHTSDRPKRKDAIVQAQLGICTGTDRLFADNCRFISRLNLCPFVGARRSLYRNCYFECTDDALTGSAVYLGCKFTFYSGKPFYSTASTGAVFLDCDIHTLVNGTQYLTKVPGMVTMIDTRITADNPVTLQWTRDSSPIRCYQSNVTLNGMPVIIDADRPELSADISASPLLKAYKFDLNGAPVYNILNLVSGDDGWDPLSQRSIIAKAERIHMETLGHLPVSLKVTPSSRYLRADSDTVSLSVSQRRWGDYELTDGTINLTWKAPTILKLCKDGVNISAISCNTFPRQMQCVIEAIASKGMIGATSVSVAPYLRQAPEFITAPVITNSKNSLTVEYELDGDEPDDSRIIWYRSTRSDLSDTIAVRHGRGFAGQVYPLSVADMGYYISAKVIPRLDNTYSGLSHHAVSESPVTAKMIKNAHGTESMLKTSFEEIPVRRGIPGKKGFWNFSTYKPTDTFIHDWTPDSTKSWYYGKGVDASTGVGMIQATRGARMSYTPCRDDCDNMKVCLIAEPAKGPGQGFGSATGQYMDICVKFDEKTHTGYALRIERTPEYDKAVTFTLVRYDNGEVSPVSESVASNCFRTPCNISIGLRDNILYARAHTDAAAHPQLNSSIKPEVDISVAVPHTYGTSFVIQHTGSVGSSATLIRDLVLEWD